MKSLGETLRLARENLGATVSQAAAATRIKYQIIDDLEHNRFQRTYAPVYAKGFIRIYGEYLGLDTAELLNAYANLCPQASPTDASPPAPPATKPQTGSGNPLPENPRRTSRRTVIAGKLTELRDAAAKLVQQCPLKTWVRTLSNRCRAALASHRTALATGNISIRPQIRQLLRGPYRVPAAIIVAGLILALLVLIGVQSARRRAAHQATERQDAYGVDSRLPPPTIFEFTHEPPPPYY